MRLGVAAVLFRLLTLARRDGIQQGSVFVCKSWSVVFTVQDCELVAKHDDLVVLRVSRAHSQARQRHEQPVQNATHRNPRMQAHHAWLAHTATFWASTGCRTPCVERSRIVTRPSPPRRVAKVVRSRQVRGAATLRSPPATRPSRLSTYLVRRQALPVVATEGSIDAVG